MAAPSTSQPMAPRSAQVSVGIIEDAAVFRLAGQQLIHQRLSRDAQRFSGGIEIQAMPALILHLGQQRRLAPQRGRAGDPVALWQHADDFGMGVLADLPDQGAAIGGRHPVVRLDAVFRVDTGLEAGEQGRILRAANLVGGVQRLRVHPDRLPFAVIMSQNLATSS